MKNYQLPILIGLLCQVIFSTTALAQNGWVNIKSEPGNVQISIDGKEFGETPLQQIELSSGNHTVIAEKKFYNKKEMVLTINPSEVSDILIKLQKGGGWEIDGTDTATVSEGFGKLTILTVEGFAATVFLDGEEIPKKTPFTFKKIPAGEHSLRLNHNGKTVSEKVTIKPNETRVLKISFSRSDLTITTDPVPANVIVKGENYYEVALTPSTFNSLKPGKYSIEVTRQFFHSKKDTINLDEKARNLSISLVEETEHKNERERYLKKFKNLKNEYDKALLKISDKIIALEKQKKSLITRSDDTYEEPALKEVPGKPFKRINSSGYYEKSCSPGGCIIGASLLGPVGAVVIPCITYPAYAGMPKEIHESGSCGDTFYREADTNIRMRKPNMWNMAKYTYKMSDEDCAALKYNELLKKELASINKRIIAENYNKKNKINNDISKLNDKILSENNILNSKISEIKKEPEIVQYEISLKELLINIKKNFSEIGVYIEITPEYNYKII